MVGVLLGALAGASLLGAGGERSNSALAKGSDRSGTTALGQSSGILPRDHLTLESALQVNLSTETVRLPIYPGRAHGKTVWFTVLDASDEGLAHDLGEVRARRRGRGGV